MKKLLLFFVTTLTSINLVKAQCDINFDYVNTGTNMTVFFTPPAASAIHAELGDGVMVPFLLILRALIFVLHQHLLMVLKFN